MTTPIIDLTLDDSDSDHSISSRDEYGDHQFAYKIDQINNTRFGTPNKAHAAIKTLRNQLKEHPDFATGEITHLCRCFVLPWKHLVHSDQQFIQIKARYTNCH